MLLLGTVYREQMLVRGMHQKQPQFGPPHPLAAGRMYRSTVRKLDVVISTRDHGTGVEHTHLPITSQVDKANNVGEGSHPVGEIVHLWRLEGPGTRIPM